LAAVAATVPTTPQSTAASAAGALMIVQQQLQIRHMSGPRHTSSSQSHHCWWGITAAAAAAAAMATSAAADARQTEPSNQPAASAAEASDGVSAGGKLISLATRQRIFFKYEKRIRDLSSLEKIYDYFATHEKDGMKAMTSQDVVSWHSAAGPNWCLCWSLSDQRLQQRIQRVKL
jgi:hypothetical protein